MSDAHINRKISEPFLLNSFPNMYHEQGCLWYSRSLHVFSRSRSEELVGALITDH